MHPIARSVLVAAFSVAWPLHATSEPAPTDNPAVQRIVIVRHGEKPEAGLGQLACRGLARSIALPDVIIAKFGAPKFLFAPNPVKRKPDHGHLYDYIRPLATIEPLAIRAGLPVDLSFGFEETAKLARTLSTPRHSPGLIVVAWEHKIAVRLVRDILSRNGGGTQAIEPWKYDDFDRMDVIEITRSTGQQVKATYHRDLEGLNGISGECPRL